MVIGADSATIFINVAVLTNASASPPAALAEALKTGRPILVAVALDERECATLRVDLRDGILDSLNRVVPSMLRVRGVAS
jgi:hypothetical protein